MPGKRKVLLVYSHYSSFVRNDHRILEGDYEVECFQVGWRPRLADRVRGMHQALWQAIRRNDQVYWWFLSDYAATGALYARLQRKRFIAVAGGWDVAAETRTGYGRLISGFLPRLATKLALRLATCVLTVSPLTDGEALVAGRSDGRFIIPNGVDVDRFRPAEETPPEPEGRPAVVTVGAVTKSNYDVKGQWVFAEASKHVPEADFYLIGSAGEELAAELAARGGPNLKITGYLPDEEMLALLQRAKVVCQLSAHESFGMGLVEGVSCGCVPVYSRKRIGAAAYLDGLGHTVPYGDVDAAARAIRAALGDAEAPGVRLRAHELIRRNIPLERRRRVLHHIMASPQRHEMPKVRARRPLRRTNARAPMHQGR